MPSLNPSSSVLGPRKAKHLLRRACFHYSKATLTHFASLTPSQAVAELSLEADTPWQDPYDSTTNSHDNTIRWFLDTQWKPSFVLPIWSSEKTSRYFRLVVVQYDATK